MSEIQAIFSPPYHHYEDRKGARAYNGILAPEVPATSRIPTNSAAITITAINAILPSPVTIASANNTSSTSASSSPGRGGLHLLPSEDNAAIANCPSHLNASIEEAASCINAVPSINPSTMQIPVAYWATPDPNLSSGDITPPHRWKDRSYNYNDGGQAPVLSRRSSRSRRCSSPFNEYNSSALAEAFNPLGSVCSNSTSIDGRVDVFSLSLSPPSKKTENYSFLKTTNFILPSKPIKTLDKVELEEIEKKRENKNVDNEYSQEYDYGGYKPVLVGEVMVDRYEVIRKLGFGHFSTVWLCQDLKNKKQKSYTAVKIVKAAQNFTVVATDEIKFLNSIMAHDMDHSGRKFIIQMLDFFTVESINGKHLCISFELMGPSLLHLIVQSDYQGITIPAVRSILKQIAHGLTYLHIVCKIIHTDIKPENILIKANENYIRQMVELCERYNELGITMPRDYHCTDTWENYLRYHNEQNDSSTGKAEVKSIVRWNSFPNIGFAESWTETHNRVIELKSPMYVNPAIEVKIADLGNGCYENSPFAAQIQTKQYRALEVLLGAGYSFPADIWSLGCLIFELATGEFLFNPKRTVNYNSREDHILQIYELFGGIPAYIARKGTKSNHYFNVAGELAIADPTDLRIWCTEDVLVEKYKFRIMDAIPLAEMINSMVELDPELRFTAEQIYKSKFCNSL